MGSEDFSAYVNEGVPSFYFQIGASDPEKLAAAKGEGKLPPGPHSSKFAPVLDPALTAGITAEAAVLRSLLQGTPADIQNFTEQKKTAK